MVDHDFFQHVLADLYFRFTEWAKAEAPPVVQVRLTDGRDFWVNKVEFPAEAPQAVIFYQEVSRNYRVAFAVPYDRIDYVVLHSDIPPEYQQLPEKPPAGFRIEPKSS